MWGLEEGRLIFPVDLLILSDIYDFGENKNIPKFKTIISSGNTNDYSKTKETLLTYNGSIVYKFGKDV